MRNVKLPENTLAIQTVSNTASANSTQRPYLRTTGVTPVTNDFITVNTTSSTVTFTFATVDATGAVVQGMADISVAPRTGTVKALAKTSGTLLTPLPDTIITAVVALAPTFTAYTAQILSDATTGIATATFTFSGNVTIDCALRFGNQLVVATLAT